MISAAAIKDQFLTCLDHGRAATSPYRYWLLGDVLPDDVCNAIRELPFDPPRIDDTKGKRETHNHTRAFFAMENRARFGVCRELAAALQDRQAVGKLESTCGVALKGGFLRIEYCRDTAGFWLEPHTDIGAKLFTMLVYLSTGPGSEQWGTDVLDEDRNLVATAPSNFNSGLIFIPAANTWHGFRKRPIAGVRKSIIVNYVKPEWRSRHELAYPDQAVG
ncbi:MAG: 2OG-Fe(II) oxygenase [Alphaproteobacteria bacterium]